MWRPPLRTPPRWFSPRLRLDTLVSGALSMAAVIAVLGCRALAAYTLLADADHLPRAEGVGVDAP